MDYGDLRTYRESSERIAGLDAIAKHFGLTNEEINTAGASAGIKYASDDVWTYYFVARCISSANNLIEDADDYDRGEGNEERIDEEADYCVPHQTYVIWTVWVEAGYDVDPDEMPFYGDDYDIESDLYKIPQAWLYYRAQDIIRNVFYTKMEED